MMKKKTHKALCKSISHWEGNLEKSKVGELRFEDVQCNQCALCNRFNSKKWKDRCKTKNGEKCPIYVETGYPGCKITPWKNIVSVILIYNSNIHRPILTEFVQQELDFLKSLLNINRD
jgi:hypothetical protein